MYSVSVPVKVGRVRGGVADEGGLSRGGLLYYMYIYIYIIYILLIASEASL